MTIEPSVELVSSQYSTVSTVIVSCWKRQNWYCKLEMIWWILGKWIYNTQHLIHCGQKIIYGYCGAAFPHEPPSDAPHAENDREDFATKETSNFYECRGTLLVQKAAFLSSRPCMDYTI